MRRRRRIKRERIEPKVDRHPFFESLYRDFGYAQKDRESFMLIATGIVARIKIILKERAHEI
jgi:hypothetical protein